MNHKKTLALLISLVTLFVLSACVPKAYRANETFSIDGTTVTFQLAYDDGLKAGTPYKITMTIPQSWIGNVNVRNLGNTAQFTYTATGGSSQVFAISALSPEQYWQQTGSYPGSFVTVRNMRGDTYIVYYQPIDTYYSGLSADQLATVSAEVAAAIATVQVEAAN